MRDYQHCMKRLVCTSTLAVALWAGAAAAAPSHEAPPFYFERPIAAGELRGKTLRELELMQATIEARAGRVFLDWWLRDYLAGASWYAPGAYDPARLSAVDKQNLDILARYRASIPRAELRKRWRELLLAHGDAADGAMQHRLAFSADGQLIAVGSSPLSPPRRPLALFRTTTGERVRTVRWASGQLTALQFAGNDLVLVDDYDARVGATQASAPRLSLMIGAKPEPNGSRDPQPWWACISPDGKTIVAQHESEVGSWSLATRKPLASFPLKLGSLASGECSFTGAQAVFVKAAQFGPAFLLDLSSRSIAPLSLPPGNSVISPDGAWIARWDQTYDGHTGDVELWRLGQSALRVRVLSGSAGTLHAAFSPDGAALLTADGAGRIVHWAVASGVRTLWRDRTDRRRFDSPSNVSDALNAPWSGELDEDQPAATREVVPDPATALRFSADGRLALVAYQGGSLQLFDVPSGTRRESFRGHEPWPENELWEATLLARALGMQLGPTWPLVPQFVDPLKHLAALDARLPEAVIQGASRARLRVLRNAIVARRGGSFESPLLKSLLARYAPVPGYTAERLSAIDRENMIRIKRREHALGGPIGDAALSAALWGSAAAG